MHARFPHNRERVVIQRKSFRRLKRMARAGLGMVRGMTVYPVAWLGVFRARDDLAAAVSDLLLIGFVGASHRSASARLLARQVRRGQVGSVFFVNHNVGTLDQVRDLVQMFRHANDPALIAIDQEGGVVQRLGKDHGFTRFHGHKRMAMLKTPDVARETYAAAGRELAAEGFTINMGPVLDVDDPGNPAVGKYGRAFDTDVARVALYGDAFVRGFGEAGILCAAKHFPGQGKAKSDSHDVPADISGTWTEDELEPYGRLIASGAAPDLVMMGHLRLDSVEENGLPATVSKPIVTGLLRERLGYEGVIVTDDIDMGAVRASMHRKEAFIRAIMAGCDLIMIKNLFRYDPLLPDHAVGWVRAAIAEGRLTKAQVMASAERVRALKRKVARNRA
ncbi:MAG: glycoside hydrolase family 3 N-terminal domain-containing protein [Pseudomonadota bacterium]